MENLIKELLSLDSIVKVCGMIISLFGIIVPLYKVLMEKSLKQRDLRFKTYHLLIKDLVQPDKEIGKIMLDRQVATCFELRNFPEYFELTERILSDLKLQWKECKGIGRIIKEIELTLKYIAIYNRPIFVLLRFFKLGFIVNILIKLCYGFKMKNI